MVAGCCQAQWVQLVVGVLPLGQTVAALAVALGVVVLGQAAGRQGAGPAAALVTEAEVWEAEAATWPWREDPKMFEG